MTYIPYLLRDLRWSMERYVETAVGSWKTSTPPAGKGGLQVVTRAPIESDLKPVTANTMFVSHGGDPDTVNAQLGSGLLRHEQVMFVDVLGENPTVALMVASDVADALRGLSPGSSRHLPIRRPSDGAQHGSVTAEWRFVVREEPDPARQFWQSVKATLLIHLAGEDS